MDDESWDDELEPVDAGEPVPVAPPRRRRSKRMGATVQALGGRGRASAIGANAALEAEQRRARAEAARRLLAGGRSKGEERGFGVARNRPK